MFMAKKNAKPPQPKAPKPDWRTILLERAKTATSETRMLDFKGECETSTEGWCGILKDIIAMANNGGGILVFGCESDGKPSGKDCSHILNIDVATFTDKVFSYTGYHFGEMEVTTAARGNHICPVLIVGEVDILVPFTRPGEYETIVKGKPTKKTAFAAGALYFRHGGKSEPATRADLEQWIARRIAKERKNWIQGVKKVVTAPIGHVVEVVPKGAKLTLAADGMKVQYSNDPAALRVLAPQIHQTHPHKRQRLINLVKKASGKTLGLHDLTVLNHYLNVFNDHPEFANKPHASSSPQYSDLYVNYLSKRLVDDPSVIIQARAAYKQRQKTT
jgi:hypothetical protein